MQKQKIITEKLIKKRADHLSDAELLAILFAEKTIGKTSINLLNKFGSWHNLLSANEMSDIKKENHIKLKAVLEICNRYLFEKIENKNILKNSSDVKKYLFSKLKFYEKEVFSSLFLNNKNQVIAFQELFQGSISRADVYPREIVKAAMNNNAASIIFAHNHTSGDPTPSKEDLQLTLQLKKVLSLVDVSVLDHVIVGKDSVVSLAEMGVIRNYK